jgi:ElaB/YqjD/DUF883 family membrane-anchored ribosome-binding protein
MDMPTDTARQKLAKDFRALTADTEELLRATANQTGERINAARARVEERLREAKAVAEEMGEDVLERTRAAAETAERTVRAHPWESVAIAAGVGFLLGMLTARR